MVFCHFKRNPVCYNVNFRKEKSIADYACLIIDHTTTVSTGDKKIVIAPTLVAW